jgi:hypothetical protein
MSRSLIYAGLPVFHCALICINRCKAESEFQSKYGRIPVGIPLFLILHGSYADGRKMPHLAALARRVLRGSLFFPTALVGLVLSWMVSRSLGMLLVATGWLR